MITEIKVPSSSAAATDSKYGMLSQAITSAITNKIYADVIRINKYVTLSYRILV
jgi:hypothetical protein